MKLPKGTFMLLAVTFGLLIGLLDTQTISDDATKVTLLLIVFGGTIMGALQPVKPWRMALAVGPGLAVVHLAAHTMGYHDYVDPDTYASRLLLLPVGLVAAGIGAYLGAFARMALRPAPTAE